MAQQEIEKKREYLKIWAEELAKGYTAYYAILTKDKKKEEANNESMKLLKDTASSLFDLSDTMHLYPEKVLLKLEKIFFGLQEIMNTVVPNMDNIVRNIDNTSMENSNEKTKTLPLKPRG